MSHSPIWLDASASWWSSCSHSILAMGQVRRRRSHSLLRMKAPSSDMDSGSNSRDLMAPTARCGGSTTVSSVEPSAPNSINSAIALSAGRHGHMRPPPATKQNIPIPQIDQVMNQVDLPPYRGPCSPLDSVAIKIIFGRIFEAFQQISQAATIDDDKPKKKMRCLPLKKMLSQK
jgi:hypothetical protein